MRALYVMKIPIGRVTKVANHIPISGSRILLLVIFSPAMVSISKRMKIPNARMVGQPIPPLRIIAPRGAPIKKRMMQEKARVNFLCHSILCRLMNLLRFSNYSFMPSSVLACLALLSIATFFGLVNAGALASKLLF